MKRTRLLDARLAKGWSQEQAAEAVDVGRNTYGNWELGKCQPYPLYVKRLCDLFALSAQELDLDKKTREREPHSVQQWQNDPVVPIHVSLAGFDMLIKSRRQVLQDSLNLACAAITLSPYDLLPKESRAQLKLARTRSSYLNDEILDDLGAITASYWNISKNSFVNILSGISGHFSTIVQLLKDTHPAPIHKRLCSLASENALLLGTTFRDIKEYDLGWSHYTFALKTALDIGDIDLWAKGIGGAALLQFYWGKPQDGLALLQEAQKQQPQNRRIYPWLSAIAAEIHAGMGDEGTCLRFLEKSKRVTLLTAQDTDRYSTGFNPASVAGYEGACFVRLRKPELALPALEQAFASSDPTNLHRQSIFIADMGMVHSQLGNPKEACQILSQALDTVVQTKSLEVVQRVCKARNELDRWKQSGEVKDLDTQIRDTFTALTKLKEEVKGY
jgi:transcriptional regulator with XRE-family HTH domain